MKKYVLITITDNSDPNNPKTVEFMTLMHDRRGGDSEKDWLGNCNHTGWSWW